MPDLLNTFILSLLETT